MTYPTDFFVFDPELEDLAKTIYDHVADTLYSNQAFKLPFRSLGIKPRISFCLAALAVRSKLAGEVAL